MVSSINKPSKQGARRNSSSGLNVFCAAASPIEESVWTEVWYWGTLPPHLSLWGLKHLEVTLPTCTGERVFPAGGDVCDTPTEAVAARFDVKLSCTVRGTTLALNLCCSEAGSFCWLLPEEGQLHGFRSSDFFRKLGPAASTFCAPQSSS